MKALLSTVFLLIGLGTLFFGVRGIWRAHESNHWPAVSGHIVSAAVANSQTHNSRSASYYAKILYQYQVGGKTYSSSRIGYGDYGSGNPAHARSIVNEYRAGREVTVRYLPTAPDTSVLEPGVHPRTFWLPVFGSVFLAAGLLMFRKSSSSSSKAVSAENKISPPQGPATPGLPRG